MANAYPVNRIRALDIYLVKPAAQVNVFPAKTVHMHWEMGYVSFNVI
jgi:hypothetical protein